MILQSALIYTDIECFRCSMFAKHVRKIKAPLLVVNIVIIVLLMLRQP